MSAAAGDVRQFVALLEQLRSADNAARGAAEKAYTEAREREPGRVLASLAECLLPATGSEEVVRTQAATLLRRAIVSVGPEKTAWGKAGAEVQAKIKLALFQAIEVETSTQVRKVLIAGVASVAAQGEESGPWPELIPNAFKLARGTTVVHQESGLRLLSELVGTPATPAILEQRQGLGTLVSNGLSTPQLQVAGLNLVCEMIGVLDDQSCQAMQPVLPMIEGALKALSGSDPSALEEALQSLIQSAEDKVTFFKPRWREWVDIMFTFAGAKGTIPDGTRAMAFEWISTVTESKCKALVKAIPNLAPRALELAFAFLAEVDEDDDWQQVDEDEEEDDDDSLFRTGEAKVDFFVKKMGFKDTKKDLMALLQKYGSAGSWQGKYGAAMAMRASVEYVEDAACLDTMASMLVQLMQDQHMRVRYAALHALGQLCHDQDAEFHNRWHERLIPPLARACSDPVDRVAAMAAGCLEALIADLDDAALEVYAPQILEVFVAKLTSSSHKGVLVAVMEALGALAAGLEGSFGDYYDKLMVMLLAVVSKVDASPTASMLRGKAFECISLLGYSVGRERFGPAAKQTMQAMLAAASVADDVQTECIRDAMSRMCKVMGADFAPFLPALLPGILSGMNMDQVVSKCEGEVPDIANEEEDELNVPTDDGFVKVKTRQIGEMLSVVSLLEVFIKETGTNFFEYVRPTAEALAKILSCTEAVLHLASDIRDSVYPCWAELVQVVSKMVPAQGAEAQALVVELVQTFVDKVGTDLARAEEPEDIAPMANGVASVVRNAGAGCLQPAQVTGICDLAIQEILKSLQREKALQAANPQPAAQQQALGAVDDDEDEEDEFAGLADDMKGEEEEEEDARVGLCAIFGACIKANPEVFVSHAWPTLQAMMKEWFGPQKEQGRLLGFHIACDLCEHLGEQAVAVWPVFMDAVIEGVGALKPAERNAASFAVLLAAQSSAFEQYAGRAYVAVGNSLQKFKAKKADEDGQRAQDNIVAALVQLCLSHPSKSPDLELCWQAVFTKLPLKVDTEEGQKIHRKLFNEVQKPGGGALGNERIARVLGYLCEIYGRINYCDEDLERDLAASLVSLPSGTWEQLVRQLPPKQQKKAERVLQEGRERAASGGQPFAPPSRVG